jgi:hypothetical protein
MGQVFEAASFAGLRSTTAIGTDALPAFAGTNRKLTTPGVQFS